jgi:YtkA-like
MYTPRIFRMVRIASVAGLASLTCASLIGGCSSDDATGSGSGGSPGSDASAGGSSAGGASAGGSSNSGGGTCTGGPVTSPVDDHCAGDGGPIVQETGACVSESADAGTETGDAGPEEEEELPGPWGGLTSADDDCKYDVSYTVTPICEKQDVTFTVTLKSRVDHKAVTGATPSLEVLDPNGIPAAEGNQKSTETSDGVYKITPVTFTKKGKWTVRFHFFETCSDTPEDSPHGHAAFFIDVP